MHRTNHIVLNRTKQNGSSIRTLLARGSCFNFISFLLNKYNYIFNLMFVSRTVSRAEIKTIYFLFINVFTKDNFIKNSYSFSSISSSCKLFYIIYQKIQYFVGFFRTVS